MDLKRVRGFTLIELLVVVAIIGILAAAAVTVYTYYYKTKARLVEVTNAMGFAAAAITGYYRDSDRQWPPPIATFGGIQNTLGLNIPEGRLAPNGLTIEANGVIRAVVANINSYIDGKGFYLTPGTDVNGAITWTWSGYNSIPDMFIPKR